MPNLPKQHGDAVLSRDRTVKVNGMIVGNWTRVMWREAEMWFYQFTVPGEEYVSVGDVQT